MPVFYFIAPSVVIYDNACSLHEYALNRDPWFFKDTQFLVDRFHLTNHTGMFLFSDDFGSGCRSEHYASQKGKPACLSLESSLQNVKIHITVLGFVLRSICVFLEKKTVTMDRLIIWPKYQSKDVVDLV